jgi:N-glycosidase YbiA
MSIIVNDYDWMRNDYFSELTVGNISYPTVEHAFQAMKTLNQDERREIAKSVTVKEARQLGKNCHLRVDWEEDLKVEVMTSLIRQKFNNPTLGEKLARTGHEDIILRGYDNFWGTGRNDDGLNVMGEILEEVRQTTQIIFGVPSLEDKSSDELPPTLVEAILTSADQELAQSCQDLLNEVNNITRFVDRNDFNVNFIVNQTGVSRQIVEEAVSSLKNLIKTRDYLINLLSSKEDSLNKYDDEDEEDDYEDEEDNY